MKRRDRRWRVGLAVVGALLFASSLWGRTTWVSVALWGLAVVMAITPGLTTRMPRGRIGGGPGAAPVSLSRAGFVVVVFVFAAALMGTARHQRSLLWLLPLGASALLVNAATAVWAVRRVSVELKRGPADTVVGVPISRQLIVTGPRTPVWVRAVSLRGARWIVAVPPMEHRYVTTPSERGVFSHESVAVLSTGPLGLVRAHRTHRVELDRPLHVAPRPTPVPDLVLPPQVTAWMPGDEIRGIRKYRSGDSRRHVDSKATARTGTLQVREFETGLNPEVTVVVDLGPVPGDAAESAASCAAGVVAALLLRQAKVNLVTSDSTGRVRGAVESTTEAGRRLARAAPSAERSEVVGPAVFVDRDGWRWVN